MLRRDGEERAGAAWATLGAREYPWPWMSVLTWELTPAPAAASDGLESGMPGDSLCGSALEGVQAAAAHCAQASALAGRRDVGLGVLDSRFLNNNNHRWSRVLVSVCGGILFLPFLTQNMCCARLGRKGVN